MRAFNKPALRAELEGIGVVFRTVLQTPNADAYIVASRNEVAANREPFRRLHLAPQRSTNGRGQAHGLVDAGKEKGAAIELRAQMNARLGLKCSSYLVLGPLQALWGLGKVEHGGSNDSGGGVGAGNDQCGAFRAKLIHGQPLVRLGILRLRHEGEHVVRGLRLSQLDTVANHARHKGHEDAPGGDGGGEEALVDLPMPHRRVLEQRAHPDV